MRFMLRIGERLQILFISRRSADILLLFCEDAPDRRSTDIQLPGHFGFADALTEELAHIGGKARNMHKDQRAKKITGTGGKNKTAVLGIMERGGKSKHSLLRRQPSDSPRTRHRVLKPTGSLYLHCDPTASHYLKLILDSVLALIIFVMLEAVLRRRFPVTLYQEQWARLLGVAEDLKTFIKENSSKLKVKE